MQALVALKGSTVFQKVIVESSGRVWVDHLGSANQLQGCKCPGHDDHPVGICQASQHNALHSAQEQSHS